MTYTPLGKFSSALDDLLYTLAASWDWAQDHDGHQEDFGTYAWVMTIEGELSPEELADVRAEAERVDPDDTELPSQIFGHWVVSTDSAGFVYTRKFETEELQQHAWELFQSAYNEWAEVNPDD